MSKKKRAKYSDDGTFSESAGDRWGMNRDKETANSTSSETKPKEKANFGLSGALAEDESTGNKKNGVLLKYSEPSNRILPTAQWRLYVFKGEDILETLFMHRQSHYLFGSEENIADVHLLHESISKQHAVLQYRSVPYSGSNSKFVGRLICKPYIIDLESTNGTFINKERISESRYYELKKGDVVRFGESTREYVFMKE